MLQLAWLPVFFGKDFVEALEFTRAANPESRSWPDDMVLLSENPLTKGGKEGGNDGAVVKPSGVVVTGLARPAGQPPWPFAPPPLLRGNRIFHRTWRRNAA